MTTTKKADAPAASKKKSERAPINAVFVCDACGRAFHDRLATDPAEVAYDRHVPAKTIRKQVAAARVSGSHESAPTVDGGAGADGSVEGDALVPAQPALECCPTHTKLCSSQTLRVKKNDDGTFEIVGARKLE